MDFYTVQEISSTCQKSRQAIYSLLKNNPELSSIAKANSRKFSTSIKYSQEVVNACKAFYGIENEDMTGNAPAIGVSEGAEAENPDSSAPRIAELEQQLEALTEANKALQEQLKAKEEQLSTKDEERKELLQQNGALLLLLQQEKQEKQALLPAPRKTLGRRIKELFTRGDAPQQ